jgi:hypothetical protein
MSKTIRLYQGAGSDSAQRLNAFPGRSLSEHSFDLMQAYVERRTDPLLGAGHPGIVEGLQLIDHHSGDSTQLLVQPGSAVGGDGRAIRVFYPIELDWPSLLAVYRELHPQEPETLDGFHFITVRRRVARVEDAALSSPCSRDQADPLRDSRIETYATLDLQFITALSELTAMSQRRAVNRLCVRHLREPVFDRTTGAVPLAIVRIDKGTPLWVDTVAGRFGAQPDAPYHTFAAHWNEVLNALDTNVGTSVSRKPLSLPGNLRAVSSLNIANDLRLTRTVELSRTLAPALPGNPAIRDVAISDALSDNPTIRDALTPVAAPRNLRTLLGVDYLPAAGRFPETLISEIAGSEDGEDWQRPTLHFDARDLQVELLPVPASTVAGAVRRELTRGAIDLVHGQGDRLRIMVAVEDRDYRHDLLDLPEVDHDLADELFRRGQQAIEAEHTWALAHRELYQNLDRGLLDAGGEITDSALALIKHTYLIPGYATAESPDYPSLDEIQREALGIPPAIAAAITPDAFFDDLSGAGKSRPYSNTEVEAPADYQTPVFPGYQDDGLYRQSADLAAQVEWLEESLEESYDLVDELNDFLQVQRLHLDAITTNFAALAGGVAGDGSGLRLMRWNNALRFTPDVKTDTGEG